MDSVESAKKALADAKSTVDSAAHTAAQTISSGAASGAALLKDLYSGASQAVDQGQTYVDEGLSYYREAEKVALSTAVAAAHWSASNPYIAYPALGATTLLLFPFTRRLMYRQTLGRFINPESVVRSCEGRVKGISSKMEDYSNEVHKLQERMISAEGEYKSGLSKLRATRLELQRLSRALTNGERSATGLVRELRTVSPKIENVLQLRSEAASHAAALRSQRSRVDKWVYRIASMDI